MTASRGGARDKYQRKQAPWRIHEAPTRVFAHNTVVFLAREWPVYLWLTESQLHTWTNHVDGWLHDNFRSRAGRLRARSQRQLG
jgi:hypothetical protein